MNAKTTIAVLITVATSACSGSGPAGGAPDPQVSPPIAAALAHPDRSAADREADEHRRPGAVLEFLGVVPGMTVLDLYSGTGYYAEILYRIVGEDGAVWAHNNSA